MPLHPALQKSRSDSDAGKNQPKENPWDQKRTLSSELRRVESERSFNKDSVKKLEDMLKSSSGKK